MCTLTWYFSPAARDGAAGKDGSYEVHFNRDERRTRRVALAPALERLGGVPVILPADGEAGGAWISVNAHGVTLALLNAYRFMADPDAAPPPGSRSRGHLVRALAHCASPKAVADGLGELELSIYRPFTLVVFGAGGAPRRFEWSGRSLGDRSLALSDRPVCSSSLDQAEAERWRSKLLREMLSGAEPAGALRRYHASHEPERGAVSVCMHREDAHTVSYSHVRVDADRIRFDYVPGAPCSTREQASVEIERAAAWVS